jgi:hypothetical protein
LAPHENDTLVVYGDGLNQYADGESFQLRNNYSVNAGLHTVDIEPPLPVASVDVTINDINVHSDSIQYDSATEIGLFPWDNTFGADVAMTKFTIEGRPVVLSTRYEIEVDFSLTSTVFSTEADFGNSLTLETITFPDGSTLKSHGLEHVFGAEIAPVPSRLHLCSL